MTRVIGGLALVTLGGLLLLGDTDVLVEPDAVLARWWPLALVVAGLWFLVGPSSSQRDDDTVAEAHLGVTAVFGGRSVRSTAEAFERAAVTAVFGDVDLDLRDAEAGQDMVVDVMSTFGDVEVLVPAAWRVGLSTSTVLGAVEHHAPPRPAAADAPLVRVRGVSVFGDVTVVQ